jgi:hypothetical protein
MWRQRREILNRPPNNIFPNQKRLILLRILVIQGGYMWQIGSRHLVRLFDQPFSYLGIVIAGGDRFQNHWATQHRVLRVVRNNGSIIVYDIPKLITISC